MLRIFPLFGLILLLFMSSCGSHKKATSSAHHSKKKPVRKQSSTFKGKEKEILKKYEEILGTDLDKNSLPLYRYIDEWYGTPYCYGGATRKCTDCSGFVFNLFEKVYGMKIPRSADKQMDAAQSIKASKLKEGDLVFFNIESKKISHVGIYLENGKFIHASTSKGVRIDNLEDKYYHKYFIIGGRIRN